MKYVITLLKQLWMDSPVWLRVFWVLSLIISIIIPLLGTIALFKYVVT